MIYSKIKKIIIAIKKDAIKLRPFLLELTVEFA
jgi:hypothetical protein